MIPKTFPAGHLGRRGLRPEPLECFEPLADPLEIFEKIYAASDQSPPSWSQPKCVVPYRRNVNRILTSESFRLPYFVYLVRACLIRMRTTAGACFFPRTHTIAWKQHRGYQNARRGLFVCGTGEWYDTKITFLANLGGICRPGRRITCKRYCGQTLSW